MHRVEMVKFTPSVTLCMFEIQLMPVDAGRMKADSSYGYTPLGSKGDQFLERFTDSYYSQLMIEWESAMNHYLQTGQRL